MELTREETGNGVEAASLGESGVGQTCLLIAGWRARESERLDPLFVDAVANIFVPPARAAWVAELAAASASTCELIACRTRYFDDQLAAQLQQGVRQVVLLGAGLDTRALRFAEPGVTFYEIDAAAVLAYKAERLRQHGYTPRSHFIPADYLRDDWLGRLVAHGFQREAAACFLWEGNTMYLPAAAIEALLGRLAAVVPGGRISFDYVSEDMIRRTTGFAGADKLVGGFEAMGAPWVTGFDGIDAVARRAGLAVLDNRLVAEAAPPSRFRPALSRELFHHYSVCTLGHE